jgi:glycosyltransferase involved in cell wall biosynthesis
MPGDRMRVLHVEVGGDFGGSLRALEVYLARSRQPNLEHDVLLYYPTAGAERLQAHARRVWSLYSRPPRPPRGRGATVAELGRSRLAAAVDDLHDWKNLARGLPTAFRLARVLREGGYGAVHVNNTWTYQAPTVLAALLARVPVVSHARNPVRRGSVSRLLLRLVDQLVADSDSLRQAIRGWNAGVPIRTCYNCVELRAPDLVAVAQLRQSLSPPGTLLIGSVGRLDDQKGYEHLVRAARLVVDAEPRARFAIVGDGPRRGELQRLIDDLGLGERFSLCGFRSGVTDFIAALDLFVSSSRWEGLPLVVVEAMLLGKRVVATDVGGNRELVDSGRTGLLVPPDDPQALAGAMLRMLDEDAPPGLDLERVRGAAAGIADPAANAAAFDDVLADIAGRAS